MTMSLYAPGPVFISVLPSSEYWKRFLWIQVSVNSGHQRGREPHSTQLVPQACVKLSKGTAKGTENPVWPRCLEPKVLLQWRLSHSLLLRGKQTEEWYNVLGECLGSGSKKDFLNVTYFLLLMKGWVLSQSSRNYVCRHGIQLWPRFKLSQQIFFSQNHFCPSIIWLYNCEDQWSLSNGTKIVSYRLQLCLALFPTLTINQLIEK